MGDQGRFDHALANPPYHRAGGTASPLPSREAAKRAQPGLIANWARALAAPLRPRGTLSLILPAATLAEALAGMAAASCPGVAVLPLWPRPGVPATLMLLRGVKLGRSPLRLLPGLVLHEATGGFTQDAQAILRGGGAIEFTQPRGRSVAVGMAQVP